MATRAEKRAFKEYLARRRDEEIARRARFTAAEAEAEKHVHFKDAFKGITPGECFLFAGQHTRAGKRTVTEAFENHTGSARAALFATATIVEQSSDWALVTCPKCIAGRRAFYIEAIADLRETVAALADYEVKLAASP